MSRARKAPESLPLPGFEPKILKAKPMSAKFSKGVKGAPADHVPSWRVVSCSGCGEDLNVRDDVKEPVLCDPCDYEGVEI